jgi:hypothetical protein
MSSTELVKMNISYFHISLNAILILLTSEFKIEFHCSNEIRTVTREHLAKVQDIIIGNQFELRNQIHYLSAAVSKICKKLNIESSLRSPSLTRVRRRDSSQIRKRSSSLSKKEATHRYLWISLSTITATSNCIFFLVWIMVSSVVYWNPQQEN